ncbi:MAG TPA: hypothetical protein V6D48_17175 [Oculatellaceae cyanobacterium]
MPEREITEVLGAGSSQSATEIRISKAGLSAVLSTGGYTFAPADNNTLDEIMAALACAGLAVLTPEARELDPLLRNVEFRYDPATNFDTLSVDGQTYQRHTVEVSFYKSVPTPKLNPSDLK